MICPKCKIEYREGFDMCADCNVKLVQELPVEPHSNKENITDTPYDGQLICVKTYFNKHEADVASGVLESNGVDCYIQTDDCGGQRPYLAYATGIRLMVKETDVAQVIRLLGESS